MSPAERIGLSAPLAKEPGVFGWLLRNQDMSPRLRAARGSPEALAPTRASRCGTASLREHLPDRTGNRTRDTDASHPQGLRP
jgi:hypothetical protein